jgi:hypothetical protein
MKLNSILLLIGLIILVISKEPQKTQKIKTEIEIVTTKYRKEEAYTLPLNSTEEEGQRIPSIRDQYAHIKNGTEEDNKRLKEEQEKKERERKKKELEEKERNQKSSGESESEKAIREARSNVKQKTSDKFLILTAPYQDNEDYIIAPLGLGTPVNFAPLQIDTTSYKSWVSSVKNEQNPSVFNYNVKESETGEESGEWDSVVDEEGTISGNVLYDKAYLGKFEIDHFKFIEAVEFEDDFHDFRNGKLGLGNCHYAEKDDLEYCLIQRLKDNGSIDRRIFSIREYSDTHGELVIGDVTSVSKEKDYPLLPLIDKDEYDDIEDDEFKMGWITKISHVIFRNNSSSDNNLKKIFKNNIYIEDGLASFDSSSHYIEAPYSYINEFEEKMFEQYYPNVCRKVNDDGTYMFLCDKKRFEEVRNINKDLTFIIVMDGNGFEIPMDFLFEQTRQNDYEFFVHFKDYEQNIWNLGHPFFHHYTIIFDQDNQEIGIDGEKIYSLKDETEAELNSHKSGGWWKILLLVLLGLLILAAIFWIMRKKGINMRLDNGINPSLVDNESVDDLSLNPSQNVN